MRRILLVAALLLAPISARAQSFMWNFPITSSLSPGARWLVQQSATGPYTYITPQQMLGAGFDATFGNVTIGGSLSLGSLNGTPIGNVTPDTGAFTTLSASGLSTLTGGGTLGGTWGGSLAGSGASINFGTGAASFGTLSVSTTIAPSSASLNPFLNTTVNVSGTATGSAAYPYSYGQFIVNSDDLALSGSQMSNGFIFLHNYGGSAMVGNRQAVEILLNQTAGTGNMLGGDAGFYVGQQVYDVASHNDNGTGLTASTAHGRVIAAGDYGWLQSGATNYYQIEGLELSAQIDTGSSASIRAPLAIADVGGNVQGSSVDAGIYFYNAGGVGFQNGILFGAPAASGFPGNPVTGTGTYIADGGASVAYGIHFTGSFSQDSIAVPGMTVGGSGNTAVATLGVGTSAPGVDGNAIVQGTLSVMGAITLPGYTVATLPTCNSGADGDWARVTDATSPTYNGALTGGGTVGIPVYCNGTAWTAH